MEEKKNLKLLIEKIQKEEILLPDFQRGFVWKKEEMQKKLAASVLTKMPIGSILLLDADANEYGCKIIGRKTRVDTSRLQQKNVKILLDGQQRMTVLTNIFSNIIFEGMTNDKEELISQELKKRFFIRIPKHMKEEEEDIWGVRKLCFPITNPESDYPSFLSEAAYNTIETLSFRANGKEPYHPHRYDKVKLQEFCCHNEDAYRIPLFLLVENPTQSKMKNCLKSILKEIVHCEINRKLLEMGEVDDKERYIKEHLAGEYEEIFYEYKDEDELRHKLEEVGEDYWADRILNYLTACITGMEMTQIVVEKSDRVRAIDIYENLNLGGVSLSTFELVLAKAAKTESGQDKKNLYEKICDFVLSDKEYSTDSIPDRMYSIYEKYRKNHDNHYCASKNIGCLDEKKNVFNKKYTDAFLNVLSLYCHNPHFHSDEVKVDYIKRNKILELSAKQINDNYEKVCVGLDRACLFLQMRCGVKDIQDMNYALMLVLLGYLLMDERNVTDRNLYNRLEAWYWSALFSGELDSDQNVTIMKHIKNLLDNDIGFIEEMKDKMFHDKNDFSSKATLLMEKKYYMPKLVIQDGFCQFYLMQTYQDLCEPYVLLNAICDEKEQLQKHHIIPLGSDKQQYNKSTKEIRKKADNICNSPLNFVYITKQSNLKISSRSIGDYKQICKDTSFFQLKMNALDADWSKETNIKELLGYRFDMMSREIKGYVEQKLQ